MFAACHIIAAYLQQKLKLFSSTSYYSPGIRNKNLVMGIVRMYIGFSDFNFLCIHGVFIKGTSTHIALSLKIFFFFTGEIDSKLSPHKTLQLNDCHNCHDAKITTC